MIESRTAAGLTQLELAAALGIQPQLISRYERAECFPKSAERIGELAVAMGRSFEWLATGRGSFEAA